MEFFPALPCRGKIALPRSPYDMVVQSCTSDAWARSAAEPTIA